MIIKHCMISCPRPVNYISMTLESFKEEWPGERITVYEEPGHIGYRYSYICDRVINKEKTGCVLNWLNAVTESLKDNYDYLVITEDDIEWRPGSGETVRQFLQQMLGNNIGYISAYCANVNKPDKMGWTETALRKFGQCGALCIILPRASAEKIIKEPASYIEKSEGKHLDTSIGYYFEDMTNYTHNPTLILHNGAISCSDLTNKNNFYTQTREPAL